MIKKRIINIWTVLLIAAAVFLVTNSSEFLGFGRVYASTSADIQVGDHIYMGCRESSEYTGLPYWRVIDKKDGRLFLMSEYLWTGRDEEDFLKFLEEVPPSEEAVPMEGYEENGYVVKGSAWQGSNAQNWCKGFEAAILSDINGLTIEETTVTDKEFASPDATENSVDAHIIFAWTREILKGDKVFFLSAEEAARYMPSTSERLAFLHNGKEIGEKKDWWLRSPRLFTSSECAGKVFAYGSRGGMIGRQVVSSLGAARPAFWATLSGDAILESCNHESRSTWIVNPDAAQRGYSTPAYKWSSDNKKCTATAMCRICGKTASETSNASSKVTKAATTTTTGITTHTAKFTKKPFTTQTKKTTIAKKKPVQKLDSKMPRLTIKAPAGAKKAITVKWKKLSNANMKKVQGIEIQYALNSKFTNKPVIKTAGKAGTSLKLKGLKSKKYYWVRVRTYRKSAGNKYYSKWSAAKKIKTK